MILGVEDIGKVIYCVFVDWWRLIYGVYIWISYRDYGFG